MTDILILCRFAQFAAAMSLFGASVFCAALAPERLARAIERPMRRLCALALSLAAATCVLWLALEAGEMGGGWADATDPATIAAVLRDTAFGHVWAIRLALALGLVVLALWRGGAPRALDAILAGLFLASLGLVGHAAMRAGAPGALERANQALHLTAAGFWLGSLAPLLVCLRRLGDPVLGGEAARALRRFSGLGHLAVAAVLGTGIVNTFVILGRWPFPPSSPYQAGLAAKIVVVAAMILIALVNRYRLTPRLRTAPDGAMRALRRNTITEMALGAAALALVSAFATFEPV